MLWMFIFFSNSINGSDTEHKPSGSSYLSGVAFCSVCPVPSLKHIFSPSTSFLMDGFRTAPWWDSDTEAIRCILARHLTVRGLIIESVLPVFAARQGHLPARCGCVVGRIIFTPNQEFKYQGQDKKIASLRRFPGFYYEAEKEANVFFPVW